VRLGHHRLRMNSTAARREVGAATHLLDARAANVTVEQDSNENLKPSKQKSHERIDGISALVNALTVALPAITGSVYDERPPLLVDL